MELRPPPAQETLLAAAFADFIAASAKLELSYRDLQAEVSELSLALTQRNQELHNSRSENRSMGITLQRIVEAMPCGVLVVEANGAVRLANPEAARLLALSAAQMPTLSSIQAKTGLDLRMLSTEGLAEDEAEQELCFESSAGRHWIAVRRVNLFQNLETSSASQGVAGVLTLQDISGRKRLEEGREAAREAVALAQVSALLAHEIRNPLASLELFAGLITDDPERREEWTSHLRAGIRSLSRTVNNVLTLHSSASLPAEQLDPQAEAELATSFLQPLARQAQVALVLEKSSENSTIRCNKTAFHQLLMNLCSNALRHTKPSGMVQITCTPRLDGKTVHVSVADTGCGIAEEHLPRIFEGGFSGSGATPGLGLAVCERLMQQHKGSIAVQSHLGQGSTFTLEFLRA